MTPAKYFRLKQPRHQQYFVALIVLFGFALRIHNLGKQSLWYDETVSAFLAGLPVAELVAHTARDIHPPGYYFLLRLWTTVAGNNEMALAYFSLVFGVLLIPLTFWLAKYLVDTRTAMWGALLVAVSPYNIWYSQEVRMYTLGAACGLVATGCALRALHAENTASNNAVWRYWAGYVITAATGLYALYYFSFLLIAINLFFLVAAIRPQFYLRRLLSLIGANLLLVLIYLPWIPVAWKQAANPPVPAWRSPPTLWTVTTESWSALSLGQSVDPAIVWPVLLLSLALLGPGIFFIYAKRGPYTALFLLAYTFGPLLLIYLLSFITPLYHVRYLFTYSPAFYIVLGAGLTWLTTRIHPWIAAVCAGILLAASFYALDRFHNNSLYESDDFRAAIAIIEKQWQPGDALLANAGYTHTVFSYYTDLPNFNRRRLVPYSGPQTDTPPTLLQTGAVDGSPQLGWGDPRSDFYAMSAADTLAALEQLARDYPRVWMLRAYDTVTDPNGLIRNWLSTHAIPLEDQPFSGQSNIRVQGFLLQSNTPPNSHPVPFDDGLGLLNWQLPQGPWQAGQTIPLKLWWTATASPGADYKMSLKLWSPDGQLAAQGADKWPGGSLFRATKWPAGQIVYHPAQLALPAGLASGQYWLNVELYHPETIQPLPRLDDGTTVVTLGPVQVQ